MRKFISKTLFLLLISLVSFGTLASCSNNVPKENCNIGDNSCN